MKERIAVFGLGNLFKYSLRMLAEKYEIVALVDNCTKVLEEHPKEKVCTPDELQKKDIEHVVITVIDLDIVEDIKQQLIRCGVEANIISLFEIDTPIVSGEFFDIVEISGYKKRFLLTLNRDEPQNFISDLARKGIIVMDPWLQMVFPNPGTFLDIGANIGVFSLSFAANGWKGYSFEASSKNVDALRNSVALNRFDIEIVDKAVHNKTGDLLFAQNGPWGVVHNDRDANLKYETVSCTTLDDWMLSLGFAPKIDLIKMDIEGSEVAALQGMQKMLEATKFPPIFIEVNDSALRMQGETAGTLISIIHMMGYKTYEWKNGCMCLVDESCASNTQLNDFLLLQDSHPIVKELCGSSSSSIAMKN